MRIVVTASEMLQSGSWDEFCELKGINVWAINEGRLSGDEEFSLTLEEAQRFGLVPRREGSSW